MEYDRGMRFDFQCPWCGAEASLRGAERSAWSLHVPCELCSRDMVISYDGGVLVSRCADGPLARPDETVRIRQAR